MSEELFQSKPLHTANIQAKNKTYFFNVRVAKNGSQYLTITESRIKEGQKTYNTISVFPDQLQPFGQAMLAMAEKVQ